MTSYADDVKEINMATDAKGVLNESFISNTCRRIRVSRDTHWGNPKARKQFLPVLYWVRFGV